MELSCVLEWEQGRIVVWECPVDQGWGEIEVPLERDSPGRVVSVCGFAVCLCKSISGLNS